jgi:Ca-activated chloride channel family protein
MRRTIVTGALVLLAAFAVSSAAFGAGLLVPAGGGAPLSISSQRVEVDIRDQIASTKITQVFRNDADRQLEAIYTFPVPSGASVTDFVMWIDGKEVRGAVLDKTQARHIYESIVRRARDPGLLEQTGHNTFKVSVFPVPAKGEQKIQIEYFERIGYDSGTCSYVYPLRTPEAASVTNGDFTIVIRMNSRIPMKTVTAVSHKEADIIKATDHSVMVSYEKTQCPLDRDFEVSYVLARPKLGTDVSCFRQAGEDGYFMLSITPPETVDEADILPKDVCFVMDTSGSMLGDKIAQAKAALNFCLKNLRPTDSFNVTGINQFQKEPVPATPDNIQKAADFVEGFRASGGTAIDAALQEALKWKGQNGRPYIVMFLTDGQPTIGITDTPKIEQNVMTLNTSSTRIFTFGVGDDVDRKFLERLAENTRAVSEFVAKDESIETKISRLQKKVDSPVLAGIELNFGAALVYDVYPSKLPDVFRGAQLTIVGRYKGAGPMPVVLTGYSRDRKVMIADVAVFPEVDATARNVGTMWATRQVAFLMDQIAAHGENKEVVDEIVRLGVEFRVASPYTSFLVVPEKELAALSPEEREVLSKANSVNDSDLADSPLKGDGVYDTIGVGGSSGGRFGGKRKRVSAGGGSASTESAVLSGIKWLARHQNADGGWNADGFDSQCTGTKCAGVSATDTDIESTCLATLTLLGAGYTHASTETFESNGKKICLGTTVKDALRWLITNQDSEGCFGPRDGKFMYNHCIATLAMCEGYGVTGSALFKDPAIRAIGYLVNMQNKDGGWPLAKGGVSDTVTTAWAALAVKSAKIAGLDVKESVAKSAMAFLDSVTLETGEACPTPGAKDAKSVLCTSAVLCARIILGADRASEPVKLQAGLIVAAKPEWGKGDHEQWFFAANGLFMFDGPTGKFWKGWNESIKTALVPNERTKKDGCLDGSWDPEPSAEKGKQHGRIRSTALGSLCMEVYYRYDSAPAGRLGK